MCTVLSKKKEKEKSCNKKDHRVPTCAWFAERYIPSLYSGSGVYAAMEAIQQQLEQLFHNNAIFLILRPLH